MDEKNLRVCMLVHQNYYLDARVIQYSESLANRVFVWMFFASRRSAHLIHNPTRKFVSMQFRTNAGMAVFLFC